jgi:large subunit ribosomal protein L6
MTDAQARTEGLGRRSHLPRGLRSQRPCHELPRSRSPSPRASNQRCGPMSISVKGPKGTLTDGAPAGCRVKIEDGNVMLSAAGDAWPWPAPLRALLATWSRRANRFRAQAGTGRRRLPRRDAGQGPEPVARDSRIRCCSRPPEGITIETPTQTEILIKGADKQASARPPPRSAPSARRSPTRARVCVRRREDHLKEAKKA